MHDKTHTTVISHNRPEIAERKVLTESPITHLQKNGANLNLRTKKKVTIRWPCIRRAKISKPCVTDGNLSINELKRGKHQKLEKGRQASEQNRATCSDDLETEGDCGLVFSELRSVRPMMKRRRRTQLSPRDKKSTGKSEREAIAEKTEREKKRPLGVSAGVCRIIEIKSLFLNRNLFDLI